MRKRKLVMSVAIITSIMLSGCGSSPKDTVVDYIDAWNSANLKEVILYTGNSLSRRIQDNIDYCVGNKLAVSINKKIDLHMKEVKKIWRTNNPLMDKSKLSKEEKIELGKKIDTIREDDTLSEAEKIGKTGVMLLGTMEVVKGLDKKMSPTAYQFFTFIGMNKMLRMQGVDRYSRDEYFKKLVLNDMRKGGDSDTTKSQEICESELFKPGSIIGVNIIEVKEKSPDKKIVRVELVKKSDSVKKSIGIELVNKKWVVVTAL